MAEYTFGVGLTGYTVGNEKFSFTYQRVLKKNLQLTVTIDFSKNQDLFYAFKQADDSKDWIFNGMQAMYIWRK